MKKALIVSLAAAALLLAGSQASAQVSFGFGPAARMFFEKGHEKSQTSTVFGLQAGFEEGQRVSDYFGYSAGVELSTFKKDAFFGVGSDASTAAGLREFYVDIPVRLKVYVPLNFDLQVFVFGGAVPSVCISSQMLLESEKVNRLAKDSDYSRLDVLVGGGVGIEAFEHLKVTLGYDHGLLDRDKRDGHELKCGLAKFSVAYLF